MRGHPGVWARSERVLAGLERREAASVAAEAGVDAAAWAAELAGRRERGRG